MSELRQAALDYVRRGWAVFPLQERGKEPMLAGAYKVATTNQGQVLAWWAKWPDANIGLATGRPSGLWVLDIDGEEGRASLEQLAEEHPEPVGETLVAATGKGFHLYWRLPFETPDPGRRIGARAGLDVIGGNGYLVAPPSVHPSGRLYEWMNPEVEPIEGPAWMLDLQKPKPTSSKSSTVFSVAPRLARPAQDGPVQDPPSYLRGVARAASRAVAGAAEGTRNHELFKQAAWLCSVAAGLRLDDGPGLRDIWQAARMAGLEEREIERTLESAMTKGRSNPGSVR